MFLNNLELKLLILVVLLFSSPYLVETQDSASDCDILAAVQQDNSWVINCSFSELGQDTINIYETKNDGILDFVNEIWIFDAYSDGRANLIISFVKNDEGLFAFLYDDQDRNGEVDYEIVDNVLLIQEGNYPTITIKTHDAWWERDGIVNYNLEISIDGLVRGMYFMGNYNQNGIWVSNIAVPIWAEIRSDGNAEILTRVYDTDVDGHPDYFVTELQMEEFSRSSGVHRLEMAVNVYDNEIAPLDGAILWPYLTNSHGFVQDYNANFAPIQIDWEHSILTDVGEFVASRGSENNYFIYSINPLDNLNPDGAYIGNFENPFAFYDLAQDADGVPELQIRNQYASSRDAYFVRGIYNGTMNDIRYSWDQNNDGFWDYKVDLAGASEITTDLSFDNLNILSIPYDDFPNWAIGSNWSAISFVASEGNSYLSSEGIYDGNISDEVRGYYLTGFSDTHEVALAPITLGMRVDYNLEALSQPYLYMNSIDYQLHLRGAKAGMWFISENPVNYLYYEDLDLDGYFDHWQHFVNRNLETAPARGDISRYGDALNFSDISNDGAELLEELIRLPDKLVYYDVQRSELAVKSIHVEPSLFETLPPRTHQEWLNLSALLLPFAEYRLAEGNLTNLFTQFDTPFLLQGRGVTVSELRAIPDGLRFLLNVANNAEISGDLVHEPIRAGSHIVELSDLMQVYPATIPNIELSGTRYEATALTVFEPINVVWELHNSSRRDALEMPVQVRLISPSQQMSVLTDTTLRLFAEEDLSFSQLWYPQTEGNWTLELVIGADTFPIEFSIVPSETNFTPQEVFSLFGDIAWGGIPIFLMLLAIGLIPAILILIVLKQGDKL